MRAALVFGLTLIGMIVPALADQTGLAAMHSLRREGGRTCMADHFHYGSAGRSKEGTKKGVWLALNHSLAGLRSSAELP